MMYDFLPVLKDVEIYLSGVLYVGYYNCTDNGWIDRVRGSMWNKFERKNIHLYIGCVKCIGKSHKCVIGCEIDIHANCILAICICIACKNYQELRSSWVSRKLCM